MILDKIFHSVLDPGRGSLLSFDKLEADVSLRLPVNAFSSIALSYCAPLSRYLWRRDRYDRMPLNRGSTYSFFFLVTVWKDFI